MSTRRTEQDWSSDSQALFRSARGDHAPTDGDRARVRDALAERLGALPGPGGEPPLAADGVSPASFGLLGKIAIGVACVAVGTVAIGTHKRDDPKSPSPEVRSEVAAAPSLPAADFAVTHGPAGPTDNAAPAIAPPPETSNGAGAASRRSRGRPNKLAAHPSARTQAKPRPAEAKPIEPGALAESSAVGSSRPEPVAASGGTAPSAKTAAGASASERASPSRERGSASASTRPKRSATQGRTNTATANADNTLATRAGRQPSPTQERTNTATANADNTLVTRAGLQPSATPANIANSGAPDLRARPRESPDDTASSTNRDQLELAFIARINAALNAAQPKNVLALCAEHERRWPAGTFVQEREGLRAIASCNANSSDAAAQARHFFTGYPRAALTPRVRDACAPQLKAASSEAARK